MNPNRTGIRLWAKPSKWIPLIHICLIIFAFSTLAYFITAHLSKLGLLTSKVPMYTLQGMYHQLVTNLSLYYRVSSTILYTSGNLSNMSSPFRPCNVTAFREKLLTVFIYVISLIKYYIKASTVTINFVVSIVPASTPRCKVISRCNND